MPTPTLPARVDVAIIGGGIMGTSLAWHLARRGATKVAVLERATIAAGASGRTGGLLRQHYSNRPEAILAHESLKVFRHWPEIIGGPPVHDPVGLVVPIPDDAHASENVAKLHRNIAMQNAIGIECQVITPAELHDLQPHARVDDLAAVAYEPTTGYADAVAATRAMALAAQRAGAKIVEGCPVLAITTASNRVSGVQTTHGPIAAETVVCVAGPWSPPVLARIGIQVPVAALRVQVVVVHRPLTMDDPHCVYLDPGAGFFCRPMGPGRTLVGVGGGDQHDAVDPNRYDERNDLGYPDLAIATLARRLPAMADAAYLHGHAGLYDMTPDAHPIIGPAPIDGLFLALGFSGAGFKKGPAVGALLADLILDGHCDWLDPTPFRHERFADDGWQTPWSANEYHFATDFGHGF